MGEFKGINNIAQRFECGVNKGDGTEDIQSFKGTGLEYEKQNMTWDSGAPILMVKTRNKIIILVPMD